MSGHHCPRIHRAGRYGATAVCACGWTSSAMTTTGGASVAWALHIRDRAARKAGAR